MTDKYYTDYATYLDRLFPGVKVQKLSVNIAAGCPNRDGTIGTGGCIYCDNRSFTPSYCRADMSVTEQLQAGKRFFGRKYPQMKYLAYFQSYTGTYGGVEELTALYAEALQVPDVLGLVIGTRPDCMPQQLLHQLAHIDRSGNRVIVEYGAESSHDRTLQLINRGHTWQQVCDTVHRTAEAGISCGLHLIAGLPGENDNDVLQTVHRAVDLPIDTLKMHQLQVIRDTRLHRQLTARELEVKNYSIEDYINLCVRIIDIVQGAAHTVAIERFISQAPPGMVVSPHWGIKNYQFVNLLHARLRDRNIRGI